MIINKGCKNHDGELGFLTCVDPKLANCRIIQLKSGKRVSVPVKHLTEFLQEFDTIEAANTKLGHY